MRSNKYEGACGGCGIVVAIGAGHLVGLPGSWSTLCLDCVPVAPPRELHDGWHRTALASLDLETTGVDPHTDRVLSYALLGADGIDVTGLVNPGIPVPAASAVVHGLTEEILADAPAPVVAITAIVDWVQALVDHGIGLVVFNAAYDLTMLRAEADRWGIAQPDWQRLLVVDPYVVDWGIERGGLGSRRLVDVSAYYGVAIENAHDATCDARAARDVAYEIGARHPGIGGSSLAALMSRQRQWFAGRAADWNDYARRAGRSLDDPHGWPLAVEPATDVIDFSGAPQLTLFG